MPRIFLVLKFLVLLAAFKGTDANPSGHLPTHLELLSQASNGASLASKAEIHNHLIASGSASLSEASEGEAKLRSWLHTLQAHQKRKQTYQENMATMKRNPSMQESFAKFMAGQHKIRAEKWKKDLEKYPSMQRFISEREKLRAERAQRLNQQGASLASSNQSSRAPPQSVNPWGNILPSPYGHWKYNDYLGMPMFESNDGMSQAKLDPPGTIETGLAANKKMVEAVHVSRGVDIAFKENSVNNEKTLYDAMYYDSGHWDWKVDPEISRLHQIPTYESGLAFWGDAVSGIVKFYHEQWVDEKSHLKSAYEPNFFEGNSEYFGPFKIDYALQTLSIPDWNFQVDTDKNLQYGRGNMAVGQHHFYYFAKNSFIAGMHNVVQGNGDTIYGGNSNQATGTDATINGGQGNVAVGEASHVSGGMRNEALGDFSSIRGGVRNRVESQFGSIAGGERNVVMNTANFGVVLGGAANKAQGKMTVVNGGWGNVAKAELSVVAGGQAAKAVKRFDVISGRMPGEDEEVLKEAETMTQASKHGGGASAQDVPGAGRVAALAAAEGNG